MDRVVRNILVSRPLQPIVSKGSTLRADDSDSRTKSHGFKAAGGNVYGNIHVGDQARAVVGDIVHHHHYHHDQSNAERSELQHVVRSFIGSLVYPGMTQRINDIPMEHEGTFEWVFNDSVPHKWSSFRQWLSGDKKFYWISGKAGCGKSTLMKMIWSSAETETLLQRNSIDACILKHSFWLPGTLYQKNFKGLLLSLVNQVLSFNDALVEQLLIERKHLRTKSDLTSWSLKELSQLSKHLLCGQMESSLVCLFLDGLDEIEAPEDREHVLDYLDDLATLARVKMCVSSRSQEPWISQFRTGPRLRLQDLTRSDITKYARARLQRAWSRGNSTRVTNQQLDGIVTEIGSRAEGVFLWARLAVTSLLRMSRGASAEEISARLTKLPKEIADLYRDMLRRRDEEPVSVMQEAASYLKLLVDPWGLRVAVRSPTIRLCVMLHRLSFEKNMKEGAEMTPRDYLSECDQIKDRIRDICAGMVTFVRCSSDTNNYSFDDRAIEEEAEEEMGGVVEAKDRFGDLYLGFHHRSVLDFLTDHVDGRAFLKNSKFSEADLLTVCVDAECLNRYPNDYLNVYYVMKKISRFHKYCPTVNDVDKAQAIRRLICKMNRRTGSSLCNTRDLTDIDYVNESPHILKDFYLDGETPYYRPAIDIAGHSLREGIPSFFNVYLARYLAPNGAHGQKLTTEYRDYLLGCSMRGDLPEVALQLLRAGADLHALRPRISGGRWLRRTSDELADLFFGPRGGCASPHGPCRGERLHAWRQVLAEHQVRSSYSMFYWSYSTQFLRTVEEDDQHEVLLILIDIGRCCELVKEDILFRGLEDATRTPCEIAPTEYIGFAINASSGRVFPMKLQTLQFMPCRNREANRMMNTLDGSHDPDVADSLHQQLLQHAPWMRPWLTSIPRYYLYSLPPEHGPRDLMLMEKLEMFWTHARNLGLMYNSPEDGTIRGCIPRFESV